LSDRQKSPEFYAIKNVKKKAYSCIKKRKAIAPASTADPKKVEKIDFHFYHFFAFLCRARRGDHFYSVHAYPYSNITEMRALLREPAKSALSFSG
jgi:hypothetical protein